MTFPERTITSEPKFGTVIEVETPTHIAGVFDFASGAVGTMITSFDVWGAHLPPLEIHGSRGSLAVPSPNGFGGIPRIRSSGDPDAKGARGTAYRCERFASRAYTCPSSLPM